MEAMWSLMAVKVELLTDVLMIGFLRRWSWGNDVKIYDFVKVDGIIGWGIWWEVSEWVGRGVWYETDIEACDGIF